MPVGTRPCPSADPQKGASLKCPLRIRSRFILTCAILSCAPRKYTKELRWAEGLRLWLPQGMGGSRCLVPVPRVRTASAQGVQGPRHGGGAGGSAGQVQPGKSPCSCSQSQNTAERPGWGGGVVPAPSFRDVCPWPRASGSRARSFGPRDSAPHCTVQHRLTTVALARDMLLTLMGV